LSPDAQRTELEGWASRQGAKLIEVHEEIGVHGDAPLADRPGLVAAIDALARVNAGVLVVWRRDRLGRDSVEVAMAERLVERGGARVCAATGATNGTGPEAQLMRRIVDAFAEYELALIRSRTRAGLAVKRRRHELTASRPAYGWRIPASAPKPVDGRRRQAVKLERDRTEQRNIRAIQRLRSEGFSLNRIAAHLNDEGVPARGARWYPATVSRILQANPL
jgi:DNA invertase Pin-like site-specific DNA recombinase